MMKLCNVIVLFLLFGVAFSQPVYYSQSSVFNDWIPIIVLGILVGVSIAAVYYMIGVFLGNARVKGSALNELAQSIGTILIVLIIVGILYMIGSGDSLSFSTILGSNGQNSISNMCTTLGGSQIDLLNSANLNSIGALNAPPLWPTAAVCDYLIKNTNSIDPTKNIDYGLAATYVILANMSNQSAANLNGIYNFESLLFFLRKVTVSTSFCSPLTCIIPLEVPFTNGSFSQKVTVSSTPFEGYIFQRSIMPTVTSEGTAMLYGYVLQMVLILLLLTLWPYLLAAGIILRAVSYTRRIGGLIIALTIVGLIIYPTLFLIEYATLSNTQAPLPTLLGLPSQNGLGGSSANLPGASISIPNLVLCGRTIGTTYPQGIYCYVSKNVNVLPTSVVFGGLTEVCPDGELVPNTNPVCLNEFWTTLETGGSIYESTVKGFQALFSAATLCSASLGTCPTALPPTISECQGNVESTSTNPDQPPCYVARSLNFYVFPHIEDIVNLYAYYPYCTQAQYSSNMNQCGILLTESEFGLMSVLSFQGAQSIFDEVDAVLSGGFVKGFPDLPASYYPQNISPALMSIINAYGIMAVTGFIIPILNLLMLISATTGLSMLMGGETSILGISRFI